LYFHTSFLLNCASLEEIITMYNVFYIPFIYIYNYIIYLFKPEEISNKWKNELKKSKTNNNKKKPNWWTT
jgi:hypothetical protein